MRRDGEEKPGVVTVKVEDLKVIYKEPLPSRIDTAFAASGQILKTLHIPIIIDRDNYIVDGHHRYYRHKLDGKKEIKAVDFILRPLNRPVFWCAGCGPVNRFKTSID